ncbi:MAG: glycosyltransferase family 4 protein [Patescibacteria group bacterium]
MRIAHITCVYPPDFGGIGTVAESQVQALQDAGEDVVVFHPKNTKPNFSFGHAAMIPSLLLRLRGFDVLHLHYPFYGSDVLVVLASILWRIPLVVTYHMKTKSTGWQGWFFEFHRRLLEPRILRRAKAVFVSSLDYAGSVGLVHKNLVECPFWVDETLFTPGGDSRRAQYLANPNRLAFLFVGGLDDAHYFKGMPIFLRACARLSLERPWEVLVVGDGNRKKEFEGEALRLGVGDRFHFLGRVPTDELPIVYRSADVHMLPSTDRSEAFGMVSLEAAASGLPSIVSDLPGVRTLVAPGRTGFVVPPGDVEALVEKMRWCLDHQKEVEELGQSARLRVEEYYGKTAGMARLLETYHSLGKI